MAEEPILLRRLIRAIVEPTSYVTSMNPVPYWAITVLRACPELPPGVLTEIDEKLAACRSFSRYRADFAEHPSTDRRHWTAMLENTTSDELRERLNALIHDDEKRTIIHRPPGRRVQSWSQSPKSLPSRHAGEPLLGARGWRLFQEWETGRPVLGSISQNWLWDGPVVRSSDGPPTATGVSGIYAWRGGGTDPMPDVDVEVPVRGHVALFGTAIVHEEGYRAEAARLENLELLYRSAPRGYRKSSSRTDPLSAARLWWERGVEESSTSWIPEAEAATIAAALSDRYQCDVRLRDLSRDRFNEEWEGGDKWISVSRWKSWWSTFRRRMRLSR